MRVLYSFPHKLGADRICYTAWQQVRGLCSARVQIVLFAGALTRTVPESVEVHTTFARGRLRVPYRLVGRLLALELHDKIVARNLLKSTGELDVVHVWPGAALETIMVAKRLGIPTVLERPNAHTRYCYEVVSAEHHRIGIKTPHPDYQPNGAVLAREEAEFAACDFLLCPSDFVAKSFLRYGFHQDKLLRHRYGFDEAVFFPSATPRMPEKQFTALFVGVDPVRKGLHLAMEAWLKSPACEGGVFLIVGDLAKEFKQKFATSLSHRSIIQLGHRHDIPALMQRADILLMPSIEEGFGLVCAEAIAAGCVPLASNACTEMCRHMENALIHNVGDVGTLSRQIEEIHDHPELLVKLRAGALLSRAEWTWTEAGNVLRDQYEESVRRFSESRRAAATCNRMY